MIKDTKTMFKQYPARVAMSRASDLTGYDPKDYSIEILGTEEDFSSLSADGGSHDNGPASKFVPKSDQQTNGEHLTLGYGAPIKVKWRAPANHSKKDWVGLYMVADNTNREITSVSSWGRWVATTKDSWDIGTADTGIVVNDHAVDSSNGASQSKGSCEGELEFAGDKLWWTEGMFEFRYHHDGKHNVMARSAPFEIRISRYDDNDLLPTNPSVSQNESKPQVNGDGPIQNGHLPNGNSYVSPEDASMRASVEKTLLPVVRNCFDRNPDFAPRTVDEGFGEGLDREGKYARRTVFAVQEMYVLDLSPSPPSHASIPSQIITGADISI